MARFGVADAEKYGGQGGGGYFSLKNDKDVARVRFLFDNINDVEGFAVHEVELDGKKRYVNCLREYGHPVDECPFCKNGMFVAVKYFVPLYNIDEDKNQCWERGKKFGAKLTSMCARYPHLVSHEFEIERNGKAGDTQTTYEIYEVADDPNVTMEDFDVQNPLGSIILDKSAEEMESYLVTSTFDGVGGGSVRRESTANNDDTYTRRTPSRRNSF